jgi:hypothetical protein
MPESYGTVTRQSGAESETERVRDARDSVSLRGTQSLERVNAEKLPQSVQEQRGSEHWMLTCVAWYDVCAKHIRHMTFNTALCSVICV